ncbi:WW domain-containing adapter protein with coiled-coil-like isoform X4 [Ostrea edulis]|nr:WW domain-containing adapter protein with coiled-coil-like isoform X4 [Ostrea edulis]
MIDIPRGKMGAPGMTVLQAVIVPDISTKSLIVRKIKADWKEELTVPLTRKSTILQQHLHLAGEVVRTAVMTNPRQTTGITDKRYKSQPCELVGIGQNMSVPQESSITTTQGQGCHSGRNRRTGMTRRCVEQTGEAEDFMTKIPQERTNTVAIVGVLEGTDSPNARAVWSLILAYIMRNLTNIISFRSSRTVRGRLNSRAVPTNKPVRTGTTRSRAQLLIIVEVTVQTVSAETVITGLHTVLTVDMVSSVSQRRYILIYFMGCLFSGRGAQLDDMDISPDTSPSSRPSSCAGTPQMGPASTPISLPTPNMAAGHHPSSTPSSSTPFISSIPQLITQISGGQNNQELTNKALQTLQKLQEVISRQIAQQTTRASTSHAQHVSLSTSTSVATHTTLTRSSQHSTENAYNSVNSHSQIPQVSSPHVSANHVSHAPSPAYTSASGVYGKLGQSQQQHQSPYHQLHVDTSNGPYVIDSTAGQSPRSDHGQKSSCASPSSTTSSQDLPVGVGDISVAGLNQTNSPNVSSSLSQYYNEKLIGHVTGWQGDQAERQARRYWEEGISVGSFHCGQVGVELKRSRSLVRLAEIQSTLHEQRILFLSTQVHELESMKAPTFSSHSFSASQ